MKKNNNFVSGESTVIGAGTVLEGTLKAGMSARIDGTINGDVTSSGTIVVANDGVVNGNISAADVKISGMVKGNVTATGKIDLVADGKLIGDIKAASLSIAETAIFEGNCKMQTEAEPVKKEEKKTE
jgi:cytoskeletal protein CcmA (bactofilin family)